MAITVNFGNGYLILSEEALAKYNDLRVSGLLFEHLSLLFEEDVKASKVASPVATKDDIRQVLSAINTLSGGAMGGTTTFSPISTPIGGNVGEMINTPTPESIIGSDNPAEVVMTTKVRRQSASSVFNRARSQRK